MSLADEVLLHRRKFKDSGYLEISNDATISSNGTFIFALDERYKPYDDVLVVNLDTSNDCNLKINNVQQFPLASGNKAKMDLMVNDISVTNIGSTTISANQIYVYYRASGALGKQMLDAPSKMAQVIGGVSQIFRWFK